MGSSGFWGQDCQTWPFSYGSPGPRDSKQLVQGQSATLDFFLTQLHFPHPRQVLEQPGRTGFAKASHLPSSGSEGEGGDGLASLPAHLLFGERWHLGCSISFLDEKSER